MKSPDMIMPHVALRTDFINEPHDEPRDSHAHFIHVGVVGGTLRITAVTLSNTTHTDTDINEVGVTATPTSFMSESSAALSASQLLLSVILHTHSSVPHLQ